MTDKKPTVIYYADCYRAGYGRSMKDNIRLAVEHGTWIRQQGLAVIIPHLESHGCTKSLSETGWLRHGIALLSKCDAMILGPNWDQSRGVLDEIKAATKWDIPYTKLEILKSKMVEWGLSLPEVLPRIRSFYHNGTGPNLGISLMGTVTDRESKLRYQPLTLEEAKELRDPAETVEFGDEDWED